MTIKEFRAEKVRIGQIDFVYCDYTDHNCDQDLDVNEPLPYDDGVSYSFLERFERAKEELAEDTKGMTLEQAKEYYKSNTEDGNIHYWGGMVFVLTSDMKDDAAIYYGIRTD